MKIKLVELDFVFHAQSAANSEAHQFTIRSGILHGALDLTWAVAGQADEKENLPATLATAIKAGLDAAEKVAKKAGLREVDPEERGE